MPLQPACIMHSYHKYEGGIDKSVPWITVWHEACQLMTNGYPKRQICLVHPHTNNVFVFLFLIILCLS